MREPLYPARRQDGAAVPALALVRRAFGQGSRVRLQDGLGAPELVRAARHAAADFAATVTRPWPRRAYRAWGRELTPDYIPWEAGLGFAVQLHKERGFIGRDALAAAQGRKPTRRLLSFLAAERDTPAAWGGELVTANGAPVGEITSAAYG